MELIDTLWNVNYSMAIWHLMQMRINRYIMECKFCCTGGSTEHFEELIDTLWNVNIEKLLITTTGIMN